MFKIGLDWMLAEWGLLDLDPDTFSVMDSFRRLLVDFGVVFGVIFFVCLRLTGVSLLFRPTSVLKVLKCLSSLRGSWEIRWGVKILGLGISCSLNMIVCKILAGVNPLNSISL